MTSEVIQERRGYDITGVVQAKQVESPSLLSSFVAQKQKHKNAGGGCLRPRISQKANESSPCVKEKEGQIQVESASAECPLDLLQHHHLRFSPTEVHLDYNAFVSGLCFPDRIYSSSFLAVALMKSPKAVWESFKEKMARFNLRGKHRDPHKAENPSASYLSESMGQFSNIDY